MALRNWKRDLSNYTVFSLTMSRVLTVAINASYYNVSNVMLFLFKWYSLFPEGQTSADKKGIAS